MTNDEVMTKKQARESRELTRMIFFSCNFFRVYSRDSRVTSFFDLRRWMQYSSSF